MIMNWDIEREMRQSKIRDINIRSKQQNRIYGSLLDVKVLC